MYVLATTWQPQFCFKQYKYAGCRRPGEYSRRHLTLHGLWPQYSDGGYPSSCRYEEFKSSIPYSVGYHDMLTYWPNSKATESSPNYDSFWKYEWEKHGTCTPLSQYDYFFHAIRLAKLQGTPSLITNSVGSFVSATALRNAFGGLKFVSLQCKSRSYLYEVRTCWSQEDGHPTNPRECPRDLKDTCSSAFLKIASF